MKQPLLPFSDAIAARQAAEDVRITRAMGRPWRKREPVNGVSPRRIARADTAVDGGFESRPAHARKREAKRAGRVVRFREVAA